MLAAVDRLQQGSVVTRRITDIREDLVDREKARPEPDLILSSIFIRDAGLLVFCSTDGVVWWEEFKLCRYGISLNYYPHCLAILRITSPTLAVNESGLNWFSTCK